MVTSDPWIALDLLRMDAVTEVNGMRVVRGPRVFTNQQGIEYVELYVAQDDTDPTAYTRVVMHGGAIIELVDA